MTLVFVTFCCNIKDMRKAMLASGHGDQEALKMKSKTRKEEEEGNKRKETCSQALEEEKV
jgi:hypothetical protein